MLTEITPGLYSHRGTTIIPVVGIVAFDLDWTLIRPVRSRFFKDANDWTLLPNRLDILQSYTKNGYTIVIFTNQGYRGAQLKTAIARVNNVLTYLNQHGIDPWILAANKEEYRKPAPFMWQTFIQYYTSTNVNFYCGDAAGRPGDYANSDREFAIAVGIPFMTPEEVFPNNDITIPNSQTLLIFVGMPGSGKSTFYHKYLEPRGWVHANQDILKTHPKVLRSVKESLATGKSVAVDATNSTRVKRREFIDLAIQYQVPTMIIYFVGNGYERNKLRGKRVPDVAYNMYFSHLEEPDSTIEGVPVVERM